MKLMKILLLIALGINLGIKSEETPKNPSLSEIASTMDESLEAMQGIIDTPEYKEAMKTYYKNLKNMTKEEMAQMAASSMEQAEKMKKEDPEGYAKLEAAIQKAQSHPVFKKTEEVMQEIMKEEGALPQDEQPKVEQPEVKTEDKVVATTPEETVKKVEIDEAIISSLIECIGKIRTKAEEYGKASDLKELDGFLDTLVEYLKTINEKKELIQQINKSETLATNLSEFNKEITELEPKFHATEEKPETAKQNQQVFYDIVSDIRYARDARNLITDIESLLKKDKHAENLGIQQEETKLISTEKKEAEKIPDLAL